MADVSRNKAIHNLLYLEADNSSSALRQIVIVISSYRQIVTVISSYRQIVAVSTSYRQVVAVSLLWVKMSNPS